jgi:hypothetical protein
MEFSSGLDVGMDETAICAVDDKGKVALEVTVLTVRMQSNWRSNLPWGGCGA